MSAQTLANCVIPPIPETIALPELPVIGDRQIESQVFTHSSFYSSQRKRTTTLTPPADQALNMDNEKMEHVGDALLGKFGL
jgi:dsRNA-specific ribonuclease